MQKDYFLLTDKIAEIESRFTSPDGWLKIFGNDTIDYKDSAGIFCYLISEEKRQVEGEQYSWSIQKGSEGKPSVYGNNTYKTFNEEGVEPFLFYKHFSLNDGHDHYVDVSEEFVLYFKLYERGKDKQNRTFYYVDDYGELDEVIVVEPKQIRIRIKYLKEYITIRDMYFIVCFDYMRLTSDIPNDWQVVFKDELVKNDYSTYSHLIRNIAGEFQSWIMGKVFIGPNPVKKTHFDPEYEYESFITGYDEEGNLQVESCNAEKTDFRTTFFKKEVLDKYYNDPGKYLVDGFGVKSRFFTLKCDNNVAEFVPVFLSDLKYLPHAEQLHWKQYNIPPKDGMGISRTYFRTMIEGNWAEQPDAIDLFFKDKYKEFNEKWEQKFGWRLYKPLAKQDEHLFAALHCISSNNIKAFCEQTLTVVKLTIDRLNEKELVKGIEIPEGVKGIGKLEKFMEHHGISTPEMFVFLRHLQSLRSGLIAHSFSETNKDCKKAMVYFGLSDGNYKNIFEDILLKSIFSLNTLENSFKL